MCIGELEIHNLLSREIQLAVGIRNKIEEEREPENPSIYFILAPEAERIKIGYSAYPEKRINQLLTSSPYELEVLAVTPGTQDEERELHRRFAHLRQHREWFTDCEELRNYINQLT